MTSYGTLSSNTMAYQSYPHKRHDSHEHRPSDRWRTVSRLGRSRRPLFIALCCVVSLIYWHTSTSAVIEPRILGEPDPHSRPIQRDAASHEEWRHRIERQLRQQAPAEEAYGRNKQKLQEVMVPIQNQRDTIGTIDQEPKPMEEQPHEDDVSQMYAAAPAVDNEKEPGQDHDRTIGKADKAKVENDDKHFYHNHDDDESYDDSAPKPDKKEKKKDKQVDLTDEERNSNVAKKEQQNSMSEHLEDLPKGPVEVQAELDPQNEQAAKLSSPDQPAKEKVIETESEAHLTLEETADSLPEIVHFTFEEVVKDMELEGWEDEWISDAYFDAEKWGKLEEPKIDFVYLWVNGSEKAFQTTKRPYEENSVLNDPAGKWIASHGTNRYRDWDELRYTIRSVEKFAANFKNKIQIIVNSVVGTEAGKQVPTWLNDEPATKENVQVLAQEEFFDSEKHVCLPTFNSLTIENQLFNTPSSTDYMYALSDDMLLTKQHAASDIVSPLFGPVMGFKTNAYNTVHPPTDADAARFGEKPFLIYTSWLLNQRFGERKRKGQGHFGHSLSRSLMREAIGSFPGPELQSACKRFRGEPGFQLYSWFVTFHYLIERHREAMLWSLIMIKSDLNGDGFLNWDERKSLIALLEQGMENESKTSFRKRNFYHVAQRLEKAGLEAPRVHTDHLWTSLDGPSALLNLDCSEFDVNECLAPGFSISKSDSFSPNPIFSSAVIFERVARTKPACGDCLLKLILNTTPSGLSPVLPDAEKNPREREIVVKALHRYRYVIAETNAQFVMITDAEQIESTLTSKYVHKKKELPGQLCLNDDVTTEEESELDMIQSAMNELYLGLFPDKSSFER